jgi:5-methylcytosine-specific restriction endonuclease McrA
LSVYVLDRHKKPLMPCSEKRARIMLEQGRARVHRLQPFTIRLVDRTVEESVLQPVLVKIDPGSKTTGMALVRDNAGSHAVLSLIEINHRGASIKKALLDRRGHRRFRRSRLRFRAPRFDNRTKHAGWLPPSLQHRVDTTLAWTKRLMTVAPVTGIAVERVRFDTQLMENPGISGVGYQNGTLAGTEVREYLLEKWHRTCAYCNAKNTPLEIDHIVARSKGGSDRVANLTLACHPCNQKKDNQPVDTFVRDKTRLARILTQAKAPLRDAAAVNATRLALHKALSNTGLPVEASTGGRTKWNRTRFGIPKTHALDATCVGQCDAVIGWKQPTLSIKATGRGAYQRTRLTAHGFPRGYLMRTKSAFGFATGDMVQALINKGVKTGTYTGRVAIRATGSFNITSNGKTVQGISHKCCTRLQQADGYEYSNPKPTERKTCSSPC